MYFTHDISPESLVKIYKALGVEATGRVAVKISTGEAGNNHYLKPTLIRQLVNEVNGTIVECGTAYGGSRQEPEKHWQTIHQHGFDSIFAVDLMDEFQDIRIPAKDQKHIKYDIVGEHLAHYDFMINLAHFKGHAMGGYGGVLKNASIGVASTHGKAYIHSAGRTSDPVLAWKPDYIAAGPTQDQFLESMAAAAQADLQIRILLLEPFQIAQFPIHLLFRVFAHAACVVDDQVRIFFPRGFAISDILQDPPQLFGVTGIHLASHGRDAVGTGPAGLRPLLL